MPADEAIERNAQLAVRCTLALLIAMAAAIASGLLAWGPIGPGTHRYAEAQPLLGIAGLGNALASLPLAAVALLGIVALKRSRWPREVVRPWRLFFVAAGAASLLAALYHLRPGDAGYLLAHLLVAAAQMLLLAGFLAERVHPLFGSRGACAIALSLPLLAALAAVTTGDSPDLRGLLLLELLPMLLLPAGALAMAGRVTSSGDWLALLTLYGFAKLCETADTALLAASGWISGHALMHLALAAAAGWLAYRALASAAARGSDDCTPAASPSQRVTSASTSA